jgi:hypothetical protein
VNSKSYNIQKSWTINDVPRLTIFLASSWGHVNRLSRSYVTQSSPFWLAGWTSWEVETWKSATLPPPPPGLQCSGGHRSFPAFFWLYLSWAGRVSYWLVRAAHSKSKWRRPIPLWWWNRPGKSYVTHNFWLIFSYSRFYIRNIHFMKNTLR